MSTDEESDVVTMPTDNKTSGGTIREASAAPILPGRCTFLSYQVDAPRPLAKVKEGRHRFVTILMTIVGLFFTEIPSTGPFLAGTLLAIPGVSGYTMDSTKHLQPYEYCEAVQAATGWPICDKPEYGVYMKQNSRVLPPDLTNPATIVQFTEMMKAHDPSISYPYPDPANPDNPPGNLQKIRDWFGKVYSGDRWGGRCPCYVLENLSKGVLKFQDAHDRHYYTDQSVSLSPDHSIYEWPGFVAPCPAGSAYGGYRSNLSFKRWRPVTPTHYWRFTECNVPFPYAAEAEATWNDGIYAIFNTLGHMRAEMILQPVANGLSTGYFDFTTGQVVPNRKVFGIMNDLHLDMGNREKYLSAGEVNVMNATFLGSREVCKQAYNQLGRKGYDKTTGNPAFPDTDYTSEYPQYNLGSLKSFPYTYSETETGKVDYSHLPGGIDKTVVWLGVMGTTSNPGLTEKENAVHLIRSMELIQDQINNWDTYPMKLDGPNLTYHALWSDVKTECKVTAPANPVLGLPPQGSCLLTEPPLEAFNESNIHVGYVIGEDRLGASKLAVRADLESFKRFPDKTFGVLYDDLFPEEAVEVTLAANYLSMVASFAGAEDPNVFGPDSILTYTPSYTSGAVPIKKLLQDFLEIKRFVLMSSGRQPSTEVETHSGLDVLAAEFYANSTSKSGIDPADAVYDLALSPTLLSSYVKFNTGLYILADKELRASLPETESEEKKEVARRYTSIAAELEKVDMRYVVLHATYKQTLLLLCAAFNLNSFWFHSVTWILWIGRAVPLNLASWNDREIPFCPLQVRYYVYRGILEVSEPGWVESYEPHGITKRPLIEIAIALSKATIQCRFQSAFLMAMNGLTTSDQLGTFFNMTNTTISKGTGIPQQWLDYFTTNGKLIMLAAGVPQAQVDLITKYEELPIDIRESSIWSVLQQRTAAWAVNIAELHPIAITTCFPTKLPAMYDAVAFMLSVLNKWLSIPGNTVERLQSNLPLSADPPPGTYSSNAESHNIKIEYGPKVYNPDQLERLGVFHNRTVMRELREIAVNHEPFLGASGVFEIDKATGTRKPRWALTQWPIMDPGPASAPIQRALFVEDPPNSGQYTWKFSKFEPPLSHVLPPTNFVNANKGVGIQFIKKWSGFSPNDAANPPTGSFNPFHPQHLHLGNGFNFLDLSSPVTANATADQIPPEKAPKCDLGQENFPGGNVCKSCSFGHDGQRLMNPNVACSPCLPGFYASKITTDDKGEEITIMELFGKDFKICRTCEPGTFQNETSQESCKDCQPGFYQSESGQFKCFQCPAGFFNAKERASACQPCENGWYNTGIGQTQCQQCPLKKSTLNKNAISVNECQCPIGTYAKCLTGNGLWPSSLTEMKNLCGIELANYDCVKCQSEGTHCPGFGNLVGLNLTITSKSPACGSQTSTATTRQLIEHIQKAKQLLEELDHVDQSFEETVGTIGAGMKEPVSLELLEEPVNVDDIVIGKEKVIAGEEKRIGGEKRTLSQLSEEARAEDESNKRILSSLFEEPLFNPEDERNLRKLMSDLGTSKKSDDSSDSPSNVNEDDSRQRSVSDVRSDSISELQIHPATKRIMMEEQLRDDQEERVPLTLLKKDALEKRIERFHQRINPMGFLMQDAERQLAKEAEENQRLEEKHALDAVVHAETEARRLAETVALEEQIQKEKLEKENRRRRLRREISEVLLFVVDKSKKPIKKRKPEEHVALQSGDEKETDPQVKQRILQEDDDSYIDRHMEEIQALHDSLTVEVEPGLRALVEEDEDRLSIRSVVTESGALVARSPLEMSSTDDNTNEYFGSSSLSSDSNSESTSSSSMKTKATSAREISDSTSTMARQTSARNTRKLRYLLTSAMKRSLSAIEFCVHAPPMPEPGYWVYAKAAYRVYNCKHRGRCKGHLLSPDQNAQCNNFLSGFVCSDCAFGRYILRDVRCDKCQWGHIVEGFLIVFFFSFVGLGAYTASVAKGNPRGRLVMAMILGLAVQSIQYLSILAKVGIRWPSPFYDIFLFAELLSLDMNRAGVECIVGGSPWVQIWISFLTPPYFIAGMFVWYMAIQRLLKNYYERIRNDPSTSRTFSFRFSDDIGQAKLKGGVTIRLNRVATSAFLDEAEGKHGASADSGSAGDSNSEKKEERCSAAGDASGDVNEVKQEGGHKQEGKHLSENVDGNHHVVHPGHDEGPYRLDDGRTYWREQNGNYYLQVIDAKRALQQAGQDGTTILAIKGGKGMLAIQDGNGMLAIQDGQHSNPEIQDRQRRSSERVVSLTVDQESILAVPDDEDVTMQADGDGVVQADGNGGGFNPYTRGWNSHTSAWRNEIVPLEQSSGTNTNFGSDRMAEFASVAEMRNSGRSEERSEYNPDFTRRGACSNRTTTRGGSNCRGTELSNLSSVRSSRNPDACSSRHTDGTEKDPDCSDVCGTDKGPDVFIRSGIHKGADESRLHTKESRSREGFDASGMTIEAAGVMRSERSGMSMLSEKDPDVSSEGYIGSDKDPDVSLEDNGGDGVLLQISEDDLLSADSSLEIRSTTQSATAKKTDVADNVDSGNAEVSDSKKRNKLSIRATTAKTGEGMSSSSTAPAWSTGQHQTSPNGELQVIKEIGRVDTHDDRVSPAKPQRPGKRVAAIVMDSKKRISATIFAKGGTPQNYHYGRNQSCSGTAAIEMEGHHSKAGILKESTGDSTQGVASNDDLNESQKLASEAAIRNSSVQPFDVPGAESSAAQHSSGAGACERAVDQIEFQGGMPANLAQSAMQRGVRSGSSVGSSASVEFLTWGATTTTDGHSGSGDNIKEGGILKKVSLAVSGSDDSEPYCNDIGGKLGRTNRVARMASDEDDEIVAEVVEYQETGKSGKGKFSAKTFTSMFQKPFDIDSATNGTGLVWQALLISIVLIIVSLVRCYEHPEPTGSEDTDFKASLIAHPGILCWEFNGTNQSNHWYYVVCAFIQFCVYIVAPFHRLWIVISFHQNKEWRKTGNTTFNTRRYFFAVSQFGVAKMHWACFNMIRNIGMALIPVVIPQKQAGLQLLVLSLYALLWSTMVGFKQPWAKKTINLLDVIILATVSLVASWGLYYIPERGGNERDVEGQIHWISLGLLCCSLTGIVGVEILHLAKQAEIRREEKKKITQLTAGNLSQSMNKKKSNESNEENVVEAESSGSDTDDSDDSPSAPIFKGEFVDVVELAEMYGIDKQMALICWIDEQNARFDDGGDLALLRGGNAGKYFGNRRMYEKVRAAKAADLKQEKREMRRAGNFCRGTTFVENADRVPAKPTMIESALRRASVAAHVFNKNVGEKVVRGNSGDLDGMPPGNPWDQNNPFQGPPKVGRELATHNNNSNSKHRRYMRAGSRDSTHSKSTGRDSTASVQILSFGPEQQSHHPAGNSLGVSLFQANHKPISRSANGDEDPGGSQILTKVSAPIQISFGSDGSVELDTSTAVVNEADIIMTNPTASGGLEDNRHKDSRDPYREQGSMANAPADALADSVRRLQQNEEKSGDMYAESMGLGNHDIILPGDKVLADPAGSPDVNGSTALTRPTVGKNNGKALNRPKSGKALDQVESDGHTRSDFGGLPVSREESKEV